MTSEKKSKFNEIIRLFKLVTKSRVRCPNPFEQIGIVEFIGCPHPFKGRPIVYRDTRVVRSGSRAGQSFVFPFNTSIAIRFGHGPLLLLRKNLLRHRRHENRFPLHSLKFQESSYVNNRCILGRFNYLPYECLPLPFVSLLLPSTKLVKKGSILSSVP